MQAAHPIERAVGLEYYVSASAGIGGRLRVRNEDFRVEEIEDFDVAPLDADPGGYPHLVFRATLTGWDTNDFAARLSDELGISRERISWAGTKDKRAVTTQLFSVRGVASDELPDLGRATIDPLGRSGRPIHFGDLAGNRFQIVVRDPERPDQLDSIVAELESFGNGHVAVPNYFGQQRFGSRRPVTHEVGLHILRGDWEGAVMAYVGNPHESEPADTRDARVFVEETQDWAAALERMPRRLGFERAILHRLIENGGETPDAFRDALTAVPTNLQRLFVNAAQSYVFNRILSERLVRGLPFAGVVEGDVVCFADADAPASFPVPDVNREQRVTAERVGTIDRHVERGRAFVTAPLVGTETTLADGAVGEIERDVLDDLDLDSSDFELPGCFHSTGTRRAILVRTDLSTVRDPVTLDFALPSGSYATVLLREVMKVDPLEMG